MTAPVRIPPPTDDKRWRVVDTAMRRHGFEPQALIDALHAAQEAFGFLDEAALRYVGANLELPPSRVFGVATFYNFFHLKPQGKHTCIVCTGTACYIKGSTALLKAIEEEYGIGRGETTSDRRLSLLTARCVGSCGLAPVALLDGQILGLLEPDRLIENLTRVVTE
ncbi:MAG TPA: NAD(P)H-dependent oxidoreductase subunit E [Chloroflexota bacterium]|nr:NAD(P)H-dependent oxidoreductase subunit E [Chloroflexota bacterium]